MNKATHKSIKRAIWNIANEAMSHFNEMEYDPMSELYGYYGPDPIRDYTPYIERIDKILAHVGATRTEFRDGLATYKQCPHWGNPDIALDQFLVCELSFNREVSK